MSDLISAAKNGYHDNLENLLSAGTSIEATDKDNATALYWGACRGHTKICETLLKSGCAIDAQVKWGSSALHAGADRGHLECVKLLISWGANVNLQNNRGDVPLHLAAYRGFGDIVDTLIAARANPFIHNEASKTPIQEAQSQSHSLAAYKLQQYMNTFHTYSSLASSASDPIYAATYPSMTPINTLWDQKAQNNIHYTPNIKTRSSTENSYGLMIEPQDSLGSSVEYKHLMKGHLKHSVSSEVTGSSLLQGPVHDYHEVLPESKSSCKVGVSMSKSGQEGRRLLENFAESLQMEVVKYSEKVFKMEKGFAELQNQICQLKKLNQELLWQRESSDTELQCTKELLTKERRKNFEVVKQQKLLTRSMSSIPETRKSGSKLSSCHVTHGHLLNFVKSQDVSGNSYNKVISLGSLQQHLNSLWLQSNSTPRSESDHEWVVGVDYEISGDGPLNHLDDGVRSGSCSLVFQIRRNNKLYILKMMTNLINLDYTKHNQGCSLDAYLIRNFGPEYHVPLLLSKHRNIVNVVHYYQGSTDNFRKYEKLLVPSNLDVSIEMARRTSFLVLDSYPQTLMSFMVNQRTICPQPCFGLPSHFLLLLLYQLLSVIDHLQCNHIVHRDVKGDNVFLDRCLRPVLADFGFARSLHTPDGQKQMFVDKNQSCAGNSHAWAPELTRFHHYGPESLPRLTSLQDIYAKSDGFAVSRMFYSLLRPLGDSDEFPQSSLNEPHYQDSAIPDLPCTFSPGLRYILHQLVLDNPEHRPTARRAMISVGVLLFPPTAGEVDCLDDVTFYLQARALKLLALQKPVFDEDKVLNMDESMGIITPEVEASFLVNITTREFWEEYMDLKAKNLLQSS